MAKTTQVKSITDDFLKSEELKSLLEQLLKNDKEMFKRFAQLSNDIGLIYKDRDLVQDVYAQGGAIKSLILALDKHHETLTLDLKADVADTKEKVEEKAEETKDTVEHHVGGLVDTIDKKKVIAVKKGKSLLQRLLRR